MKKPLCSWYYRAKALDTRLCLRLPAEPSYTEAFSRTTLSVVTKYLIGAGRNLSRGEVTRSTVKRCIRFLLHIEIDMLNKTNDRVGL